MMNRRIVLGGLLSLSASPVLAYSGLPRIMKQEGNLLLNTVEATPISFQDKLLIVVFHRSGASGTHFTINDFRTGEVLEDYDWPYGLGCAYVENDTIHVFGVGNWTSWGNEIVKTTIDLNFNMGPTMEVWRAPPTKRVFNISVCKDDLGYAMAYEFDDEGTFRFSGRFLVSTDMLSWSEVGGIMHPTTYAACPTLRYLDGWYYIIYLRHLPPRYMTFIGRTQDFSAFQWFDGNAKWPTTIQVLSSTHNEGINNSDVDLVEHNGKTWFTYATGDQRTWGHLKTAVYPGTMAEFFGEYWPIQ